MLSESFRDTVGVPDYYVDEENATTMINFWPIIASFAEAFSPDAICEIGSERGLTSRRLAELLPGVEVHVVDPEISDSVKSVTNVTPHEMTSEDFFGKGLNPAFYIIDGDHNYETVGMEIRAAVANAGAGAFCAIFHDVGWPFARRDGYYAPDRLESVKPHAYDSYLSIEDEALRPGRRGFENRESFALARNSGGSANGVLTAIEDFVAEDRGSRWKLLRIPVFYGMAVLWREDGLGDEQVARIRATEAACSLLRPLLACAEANRLRLFESLARNRADLAEANRRLEKHRTLYGLLPWRGAGFRKDEA